MSCSKQQSTATISDLPYEILRKIFLNIPITVTAGTSFVSLRTVCKRWTTIIDDCWCEIKHLNVFIRPTPLEVGHSSHVLLVFTSNAPPKRTADKFIEYCGPYLKVVRVAPSTEDFTPSIIPLIAKTCDNLEEFTGYVLTPTDSKDLRDLLDACTKLKVLKITIVAEKSYSFFQRIPFHQLQELKIHMSDIYDPPLSKYIKATIRHCKVLTKLSVNYIDDEIVSLLTTLQVLQIGTVHRHMMAPPEAYPLVNNELLVSLSETCQKLVSITIGQCINVTDEGISVLSRLPKLKNLDLWRLPQVTGQCLKNFSKIEGLKLDRCPVTDAEIIGFLKNSPTLRLLSVRGCNITDKTLAVAVVKTRKRTNNISLEIHCHQTNTNPTRFQGASPLLKIVSD